MGNRNSSITEKKEKKKEVKGKKDKQPKDEEKVLEFDLKLVAEHMASFNSQLRRLEDKMMTLNSKLEEIQSSRIETKGKLTTLETNANDEILRLRKELKETGGQEKASQPCNSCMINLSRSDHEKILNAAILNNKPISLYVSPIYAELDQPRNQLRYEFFRLGSHARRDITHRFQAHVNNSIVPSMLFSNWAHGMPELDWSRIFQDVMNVGP